MKLAGSCALPPCLLPLSTSPADRHPHICQPIHVPPQALGAPKVALLFLTKGPMHHEAAWRLWLASAAGLLPLRQAQVGRMGQGFAWRCLAERDVLHMPSQAPLPPTMALTCCLHTAGSRLHRQP